MAESRLMVDGKFRVFSDGSVNRVLPNGCEIPANISYASRERKYAVVSYWEDGKQKREYVHRLVAKAFLPNPDGLPQVNHKDGNPRNNNADNLEWSSAKHNVQHAYSTGLINHYRDGRRCASCGMQISDGNKSGLCPECMADSKASDLFRANNAFFGVVEYHKRVSNMTNEDIARQMGYAKDTIDKFMCGRRVTKNVAYKICDIFSIDKDLFHVHTN